MSRFFARGPEPWDPSHRFVTSWLLPPYALFACRALMSLYAFTTLLFNIIYQCATPSAGGCAESRRDFSYFTVLTYWGLAFYLLFAALHTFTYARSRPPHSPLLTSWPPPLQSLHALLYSSVTTYPFLVTVVYWGVLYSYGPAWFPTPLQAWSNLSQHALNSAFALFEILLPRTTPPSRPLLHAAGLLALLAL
ncbi:uncharacterized protein GGS25DRAFT_507508, partial [Hypoxylon fragiforme]|uniref:uncharacterized protein n=1 Tax=Hypoxylon fragiforme TaxID=63214 RepID=UPI0020C60978